MVAPVVDVQHDARVFEGHSATRIEVGRRFDDSIFELDDLDFLELGLHEGV